MTNIKLPLSIDKGKVEMNTDVVSSIKSNVDMILNTRQGECIADSDFGFVYNNTKFEIFNENDGVIFDSKGDGQDMSVSGVNLYTKKISGSSRNVNTFAADLCEAVASYEPRLANVKVSMSYVRLERMIYITVDAVIVDSGEPFLYQGKLAVASYNKK